jgi:hypothetical protein
VAIPLPPWQWQKANTADLHPHHLASPWAQRAFDQAGLWVIGTGVVTGLAANPLLAVVGTLADLSINGHTQIFAAAFAAELLIPGFLDAETLPVLGGLLGGGWNSVEVRLVRDRTLRHVTNHALDASPVIDVEARPINTARKVQEEFFW